MSLEDLPGATNRDCELNRKLSVLSLKSIDSIGSCSLDVGSGIIETTKEGSDESKLSEGRKSNLSDRIKNVFKRFLSLRSLSLRSLSSLRKK